jgi:hypothetical protein
MNIAGMAILTEDDCKEGGGGRMTKARVNGRQQK